MSGDHDSGLADFCLTPSESVAGIKLMLGSDGDLRQMSKVLSPVLSLYFFLKLFGNMGLSFLNEFRCLDAFKIPS